MDKAQEDFLEALIDARAPSGFESDALDVWTDYVEAYADDITRDAYGNTVAIYNGSDDVGRSIAFSGHADEIGFMVRNITSDGFLKLNRVGGSDKTISRGQHVTIHTDDGDIPGIIGQTAIHIRGGSELKPISEQHVDIGVDDEEAAEDLVEIGDPMTIETTLRRLQGNRLVGRAMDNRIGLWAAAEGLRRAAEQDVETTIYALATVQEELGVKGAEMVAYDVDPDMFVAVDVTHATDTPDVSSKKTTGVSLGEGPAIGRGSANHPRLVDLFRSAAETEGIDYQLMSTGRRTGTDADAAYTTRGGIPSLNVGLPNRYMHTPTELIDTGDLDALADLLAKSSADVPDVSFDTL